MFPPAKFIFQAWYISIQINPHQPRKKERKDEGEKLSSRPSQVSTVKFPLRPKRNARQGEKDNKGEWDVYWEKCRLANAQLDWNKEINAEEETIQIKSKNPAQRNFPINPESRFLQYRLTNTLDLKRQRQRKARRNGHIWIKNYGNWNIVHDICCNIDVMEIWRPRTSVYAMIPPRSFGLPFPPRNQR